MKNDYGRGRDVEILDGSTWSASNDFPKPRPPVFGVPLSRQTSTPHAFWQLQMCINDNNNCPDGSAPLHIQKC